MSKRTSRPAMLPLGALAAGFGFASLAIAQTEPPKQDAEALPAIRAKAAAETAPTSKQNVQATDTRIGKGKQELRDVPQSITVLTERLIDDRNLDTLKDALKSTAGISFQAAEGGEEDIRLRGFSLQSTGDIFIDGIRDPAFYERDSFNWDRLELLRGSASMLFGRGSTGGAVNQVSKQPFSYDQKEVSVTVGSGNYVRATTDLNIKTGDNAALRINAMANMADNWGNKIDKRGIAPTFRWGIGLADEFSVGLYLLDNDNGVTYGLPWLNGAGKDGGPGLVPVSPRSYYGMSSDYAKANVTIGTAQHVHRFDNGGELRSALRISKYQRDQRASAVRFAGANAQPGRVAVDRDNISDATVLTRGTQNKAMDLDTVALQSDYTGKFKGFGGTHDIAAGVDFTDDKFIGYAFSLPPGVTVTKPTTTIGTPDNGVGVDESLRIVSQNRRFDSKGIGAYVRDQLQIAPNWKVLAGLRFDKFEGKYNTLSTTDAADGDRSDSLWSRRFAVLYQPTPFASFHLQYGTSFNTSGDTYQYDNLSRNTAPEKSRNIELGGKLDWAEGKYTTSFAIFHATKYNERNRDSDTANPTNYLLSGERHAAGLDIDIAGRITPQWEVFASYAWIPSAKIDKGAPDGTTLAAGEQVGSRPGLTPKHSGTVWTTYQLTPNWRVGAGINARSGMKPLQSTIVAPRWVTGDLMAEYTMDKLAFKLNVSNFTDKHYADMLYRGHYIAGKPRTVMLTGTYTF
ncbi:MAG: TonB-dependent receptor [Aquincola tertiaricarbonis]|uniref:TonB-dependent receptor n=1 Tax=Aquincola TaxID=391952 RepID=UPI00061526E4|nr:MULTISPECIES: TonB-dependent receptor [Aquincola]MCR5865950.1 TonB-dependent receptor [Aquincola sp. J276]